jgi:hypothetical protein
MEGAMENAGSRANGFETQEFIRPASIIHRLEVAMRNAERNFASDKRLPEDHAVGVTFELRDKNNNEVKSDEQIPIPASDMRDYKLVITLPADFPRDLLVEELNKQFGLGSRRTSSEKGSIFVSLGFKKRDITVSYALTENDFTPVKKLDNGNRVFELSMDKLYPQRDRSASAVR